MAKGEAYYLKHDNDAFTDPKIIKLRMKFGLESYALYWRILEILFDEPDNRLAVEQNTYDLISFDTRTNLSVEDVIRYMIDIELLSVDEETDELYSASLDRRVATMKGISESRAEAGRRSGEARKKKQRAKALLEQTRTLVQQEPNKKEEDQSISEEVINYLNTKAGSKYRSQTEATKRLIRARQKEGYEIEDFKTVIDKKFAEWKGTDMEKFIRPETLFGTKFESYLNQKIIAGKTNQGNNYQKPLPETYEDNPNDFTSLIKQRNSEGRS